MIQLTASTWYRPYLPTRNRGTPVSAPDPDGDTESWAGGTTPQATASGMMAARLDDGVEGVSTIHSGDSYWAYGGGTTLSYTEARTVSYFSVVGDYSEYPP